jgi:hypothetical protein
MDIEFGNYPFVTSSNTLSSGACIDLRIPPPPLAKFLEFSSLTVLTLEFVFFSLSYQMKLELNFAQLEKNWHQQLDDLGELISKILLL